MSTAPTFVGTPRLGVAQILNSDGTTAKTLVTAGSSGSKIVGINVTSTDTSARAVSIAIVRSSVTYVIGTVSIAATAGGDGATPSVNLLASAMIAGLPVDSDGQTYVFLQSGDTLVVALTAAAVTSGKAISAVAVLGDF